MVSFRQLRFRRDLADRRTIQTPLTIQGFPHRFVLLEDLDVP